MTTSTTLTFQNFVTKFEAFEKKINIFNNDLYLLTKTQSKPIHSKINKLKKEQLLIFDKICIMYKKGEIGDSEIDPPLLHKILLYNNF